MGQHEQTARSVETAQTVYADLTRRVPVSTLGPGDLVFDLEGDPHALSSVSSGGQASVWIQREDLPYREHLTGWITIVPGAHRHSANAKGASGAAKEAARRMNAS